MGGVSDDYTQAAAAYAEALEAARAAAADRQPDAHHNPDQTRARQRSGTHQARDSDGAGPGPGSQQQRARANPPASRPGVSAAARQVAASLLNRAAQASAHPASHANLDVPTRAGATSANRRGASGHVASAHNGGVGSGAAGLATARNSRAPATNRLETVGAQRTFAQPQHFEVRERCTLLVARGMLQQAHALFDCCPCRRRDPASPSPLAHRRRRLLMSRLRTWGLGSRARRRLPRQRCARSVRTAHVMPPGCPPLRQQPAHFAAPPAPPASGGVFRRVHLRARQGGTGGQPQTSQRAGRPRPSLARGSRLRSRPRLARGAAACGLRHPQPLPSLCEGPAATAVRAHVCQHHWACHSGRRLGRARAPRRRPGSPPLRCRRRTRHGARAKHRHLTATSCQQAAVPRFCRAGSGCT